MSDLRVLGSPNMQLTTLALLLSALAVASGCGVHAQAPTVKLDNGIFTGVNNGTVSNFLGIPFGQST
jgi:hypothetical protein